MEIGAVKQAFNNEVILLKKKLNQAKIQIIHKLTRKAKTLTEKKAPEKLKEKFNKKAESAVREVLIIKKIKAKDIAKFIVTHKGKLNDYLNRPQVDEDKACARLLLHKALQDKYKILRERFSNVSIEDLFMSRLERRKMKKEAKEKQKEAREKKKEKMKRKEGKEPVQAEGDWNVEDVEMDDSKTNNDNLSADDVVDDEKKSDGEQSDSESAESGSENEVVEDKNDATDDDSESNDEDEDFESKDIKMTIEEPQDKSSSDDETESKDVGEYVKASPSKTIVVSENNLLSQVQLGKTSQNAKQKKVNKPKDINKNKNLKHKILKKGFNKNTEDTPVLENKVVDPFFITSTGENYMSVAEPRQPDEVKEEHSQGNRQYRRAVMFGHVPRNKPRRDNFRPENQGFRNNGFEQKGPQKRFNKEENNNKGKFNDRRNDNRNVEVEAIPEKLHPSWEAKKRQSGILPFKGKKIVFDES